MQEAGLKFREEEDPHPELVLRAGPPPLAPFYPHPHKNKVRALGYTANWLCWGNGFGFNVRVNNTPIS